MQLAQLINLWGERERKKRKGREREERREEERKKKKEKRAKKRKEERIFNYPYCPFVS